MIDFGLYYIQYILNYRCIKSMIFKKFYINLKFRFLFNRDNTF